MSVKRVLLKPFYRLSLKRKSIDVDIASNIDRSLHSNNHTHGGKKYPVTIRNSSIGNINIGYGTKIFDSVCIGRISIGRFVTIAGPSIKIVGGCMELKSKILLQ